MILRPPSLVLVVAIAALVQLTISRTQAEIRTGSGSVEVSGGDVSNNIVAAINVSWDVGHGFYYSPTYTPYPFNNDISGWQFTGLAVSTDSNAWGEFSLGAADDGALGQTSGPATTVQYFTGALELSALVDANQTFNTTQISIVGNETKRFGFSVTMPDSPSPLYGWVELDGSASTLGYENVKGSWAYDTSGAGIAVGTVPEPTTFSLVGLGCLALLAHCRFGRKQS